MELSKEPQIIWSKVKCPVCHQPTGQKSDCFNLEPARIIPEHKRNFNHPQLGLQPLFSTNCHYREKNLWRFDVNQNITEEFMSILSSIDGIESIEDIKPHSCIIAFGRLYNEKDVKVKINKVFKNYIKSYQVLDVNPEISNLIGIQFPNGKQFIIDNHSESQINYLKILLEEIPGSTEIFRKRLEK